MHLYRTTFKNEIVAEFLPPKNGVSKNVIILCDGLPTLPSKKNLVQFLSKKNYWVFHIRYRGTWESGGQFLQDSPVQDILDVIDELPNGFDSLWTDDTFQIQPEKVVVMGSSFGGTVSLMASLNQHVDKVVAVASAVDWSVESPAEPHDFWQKILKEGYGQVYRFADKDFQKMLTTNFLSPIDHVEQFDKHKILMLHAKDDKIVNFAASKKLAKDIGIEFITFSKGGHLSLNIIKRFFIYRKLYKFLNS